MYGQSVLLNGQGYEIEKTRSPCYFSLVLVCKVLGFPLFYISLTIKDRILADKVLVYYCVERYYLHNDTSTNVS